MVPAVIPGQGYFDRMYRENDDPWDFASDPYERRKYELSVAALPRRRYRSAYEPGCSVGELTALLARRCDVVLAVDRAERAVGVARERLGRAGVLDRVDLRHGRFPEDGPGSPVDLVVLSEILYYFPAELSPELVEAATQALEPGGTLVLVHWRGHSPDHACTGDEVHAAVRLLLDDPAAGRRWRRLTGLVDEGFLLDVYERP